MRGCSAMDLTDTTVQVFISPEEKSMAVDRLLLLATDYGASVRIIDLNYTPAIRIGYKWWSGDVDSMCEAATEYVRNKFADKKEVI